MDDEIFVCSLYIYIYSKGKQPKVGGRLETSHLRGRHPNIYIYIYINVGQGASLTKKGRIIYTCIS